MAKPFFGEVALPFCRSEYVLADPVFDHLEERLLESEEIAGKDRQRIEESYRTLYWLNRGIGLEHGCPILLYKEGASNQYYAGFASVFHGGKSEWFLPSLHYGEIPANEKSCAISSARAQLLQSALCIEPLEMSRAMPLAFGEFFRFWRYEQKDDDLEMVDMYLPEIASVKVCNGLFYQGGHQGLCKTRLTLETASSRWVLEKAPRLDQGDVPMLVTETQSIFDEEFRTQIELRAIYEYNLEIQLREGPSVIYNIRQTKVLD